MFTRSVEKYRLLYTILVGDGHSSSFGNISRAVHEQFRVYAQYQRKNVKHMSKKE